ncbi:MAG: DUF4190 domain-containing protein [Nocardia sp.]|nr:DUF4190 domain-containing protein [Nocardia sp.]
MTNPGDSDEWWKQYGGEGVSSDSGGHESVTPPMPPMAPPGPSTGYTPPPSQSPQQPQAAPSYPGYPQQQPYPSYPQGSYPQGSAYPQVSPYSQQGGYPYPNAQYQPYGYGLPPQQRRNGLAVASLVTSLVGIATCGVGSVLGLILGAVALKQIGERGESGRGQAIAGMIIGGVFTLAVVIWLVIVVGVAINDESSS